jgi:hypothetical protein
MTRPLPYLGGVERVLAQQLEGHDLERREVRRPQEDFGRGAGLESQDTHVYHASVSLS